MVALIQESIYDLEMFLFLLMRKNHKTIEEDRTILRGCYHMRDVEPWTPINNCGNMCILF